MSQPFMPQISKQIVLNEDSIMNLNNSRGLGKGDGADQLSKLEMKVLNSNEKNQESSPTNQSVIQCKEFLMQF